MSKKQSPNYRRLRSIPAFRPLSAGQVSCGRPTAATEPIAARFEYNPAMALKSVPARYVEIVNLPDWTPFVFDRYIDLPEHPDDAEALYVNSRYHVCYRKILDNDGVPCVYLSIRNNDRSARHDWRDFQRIKNELVGSEAEAIELYPAESRLQDVTSQFHLFVYEAGLPRFGHDQGRHVSNVEIRDGKLAQRPFEAHVAPPEIPSGESAYYRNGKPHKPITEWGNGK